MSMYITVATILWFACRITFTIRYEKYTGDIGTVKCTGEPVKSFSVHDFFLKQDEADVYWHVYSLLALTEKSWTEKLFTGSPVHFTVPISPVEITNLNHKRR